MRRTCPTLFVKATDSITSIFAYSNVTVFYLPPISWDREHDICCNISSIEINALAITTLSCSVGKTELGKVQFDLIDTQKHHLHHHYYWFLCHLWHHHLLHHHYHFLLHRCYDVLSCFISSNKTSV